MRRNKWKNMILMLVGILVGIAAGAAAVMMLPESASDFGRVVFFGCALVFGGTTNVIIGKNAGKRR